MLESPGWLDRLRARTGTDGEPAAVAGGAVIEPAGTIRQAGYFFSLFRRAWSARLRDVPEDAARRRTTPLLCPVSSELQLIRHEWIERVGLYDELLDGPHAALDYCLRVSEAGGQCVLEPTVRARALVLGDGEPDDRRPAARRLRVKHVGVNFQPLDPGGHLMQTIPKTLFIGLGASASSPTTAPSCPPSRSAPTTSPGSPTTKAERSSS